MRASKLLFGLVLALGSQAAWAAGPSVQDLVNEAIQAQRTVSYTATMHYISVLDNSAERDVQIQHLAPDLYRVRPMENGQQADEYYIENGDELVRVYRGNSIVMPVRQFSVNDQLTRKFLREMGESPQTVLLAGTAGGRKVHMLRLDATQGTPYTVTMGLDLANSLPIYLLVTDRKGLRKVYFQMDDIEYVPEKQLQAKLPDELFMVAPSAQRLKGSRGTQSLEGFGGGGSSGAVMKQVAGSQMPLPLFPNWLPRGYELEAINAMDCELHAAAGNTTPAHIYQLEAYGPDGELISIFQTLGLNSKDSLSKLDEKPGSGFVVVEDSGWTIAIFGDLEREVLMRIAGSLEEDRNEISGLISETMERDRIVQEASH